MWIKIKGKLKKAFIKVAELDLEGEITPLAEGFTKGFVKNFLLDALKGKGFYGRVEIDGEVYEIDNNTVKRVS